MASVRPPSEYPPEGIAREELHARYGADFHQGVRELVEASGWTYDPPPEVVPSSRKALEVTELARERGLHADVHTRLMHAYWSEQADIGDEDTLLGLVEQAGLDRSEAASALAERRYADRVEAATDQAFAHGINAVPAFVLDRRLLLLGVHPHDVFEQAFNQLQTGKDS